jgi:hypothetical protein
MALIGQGKGEDGCQRTATVVAKTDVEVVAFEKTSFLSIIRGNQSLIGFLQKLSQMRQDESWTIIDMNTVFCRMTNAQKSQLQGILVPLQVKKGDYLWRRGQVGEFAYLIRDGKAVLVEEDNLGETIATYFRAQQPKIVEPPPPEVITNNNDVPISNNGGEKKPPSRRGSISVSEETNSNSRRNSLSEPADDTKPKKSDELFQMISIPKRMPSFRKKKPLKSPSTSTSPSTSLTNIPSQGELKLNSNSPESTETKEIELIRCVDAVEVLIITVKTPSMTISTKILSTSELSELHEKMKSRFPSQDFKLSHGKGYS